MPEPDERRSAVVFFATCAGLWTFFAVIAAWAPRLLDDWYQVTWLSRHALTPANVAEYTRYNFFNYNPRIGETFLLLTNGPWPLRVLLNASVELGLLLLGFAIAFGRWPRARAGDALRLLVLQALIWAIAPMACLLYFYRPFTTNYLYGLCFQLALFVPYRLALTREPGGHRPLVALALLGLGWVAGMSNEHTGPAAIVALAALVVVLARRHGVRAWTLAGLAGLLVGYAMLYFAPGQNLRYAGVATHVGPVEAMATRGLEGCADVLLELVRDVRAPVIFLGLAALLVRRHGQAAAFEQLRGRLGVLAALALVAAMIAATLMASPILGERLYFAPAVLLALAALLCADALMVDRSARGLVIGLTVLTLLVNGVAAAVIYRTTYAEATARDAALRAAAPGSVGIIRPFRFFARTRWSYGDDMRAEYLRTYVASEVYGLGGMEFAEPRQDLQRTIPWRVDLDVQVDPPVPRDELWRAITPPLHYVPGRVDRLVTMMRKLEQELQSSARYRLVGMTATVHGIEAPELRERPVLAATWREGKLHFAEAIIKDRKTLPYFVLYKKSLPEAAHETLVVACGRAVAITPREHGDELYLDFQPWCAGQYAALACTPDTCWLAGDTFF